MKTVLVIPTYNECRNIERLITTVRMGCAGHSPDILVVDSASPDGTAGRVRALQKNDPSLFLLEQPAKLGLGKAYLDGMAWALARNYDLLCTMDADFSHHPAYLDRFFEEIQTHDLVVGSRYVPGGGLKNWPRYRRVLSRFANWYARTLMGMPLTDLTSGFHCFRMSLLKKILRYNIHTEGYAFLIELKFLALLRGARFKEVPIVFTNRTEGDSKISKRVILESIFFVIRRSFQRHRFRRRMSKVRAPEPEASAVRSKVPV